MKLKQCKSIHCQALLRHFDATGQYSNGPFYCAKARDLKLSQLKACPLGLVSAEPDAK